LSRATLPSTPTNLSVVSFTANEVELNWDDNPVGFTAYKVEFKLSADATWTDTGYAGTTSAYTVTGLAFNSEYNFRVSALNSSNATQSDFATATQTTLPAGPPVRINSTTWAPSEVYVRTASAWTLGAMYVWDGTAWKVVG
jgi:predicted phage tail protein